QQFDQQIQLVPHPLLGIRRGFCSVPENMRRGIIDCHADSPFGWLRQEQNEVAIIRRMTRTAIDTGYAEDQEPPSGRTAGTKPVFKNAAVQPVGWSAMLGGLG